MPVAFLTYQSNFTGSLHIWSERPHPLVANLEQRFGISVSASAIMPSIVGQTSMMEVQMGHTLPDRSSAFQVRSEVRNKLTLRTLILSMENEGTIEISSSSARKVSSSGVRPCCKCRGRAMFLASSVLSSLAISL